MKLLKYPVGTKVRINDVEGTITNKSAIEPTVAIEITYFDGRTEIRNERAPENMIVVDNDFYISTEVAEALREEIVKENHKLAHTSVGQDFEIVKLTTKREELLNEIQAITDVAKASDEAVTELRGYLKKLRTQDLDQLEEINLLKAECQNHASKVVELQNDLTFISERHDTYYFQMNKCHKELKEMKNNARKDKQFVESVEEKVKEILDEPDVPSIQEVRKTVLSNIDGVRGDYIHHADSDRGDHSPIVPDGPPIDNIVPGEIIGIAAMRVINVLNEEIVLDILKESGSATVAEIAERTNSSAKAVYRYCRKLMNQGKLIVGKLPEPDYKEENTSVWLEGKQEVSERKVETIGDADGVPESAESSDELRDEDVDKRDSDGSSDEEEGNPTSGDMAS